MEVLASLGVVFVTVWLVAVLVFLLFGSMLNIVTDSFGEMIARTLFYAVAWVGVGFGLSFVPIGGLIGGAAQVVIMAFVTMGVFRLEADEYKSALAFSVACFVGQIVIAGALAIVIAS
ncbi:MAG: hypothetical protein AAGI30_03230 [Planctomycetota bacterium]